MIDKTMSLPRHIQQVVPKLVGVTKDIRGGFFAWFFCLDRFSYYESYTIFSYYFGYIEFAYEHCYSLQLRIQVFV